MTPTEVPTGKLRERRAPKVGWAARAALAAALAAGATLMLVGSRTLRAAELVVTGGVISLGAGRTVLYRPAHLVFFQTTASKTVGLQISASCTAIFLMVPFFVLAAAMMLLPRVNVARLAVGLLVGSMVVFWLNQLRLLIIAWATHHWGIALGFDWAHILAGSVVTTLSMLIALYLFFRLALAGRRPAV